MDKKLTILFATIGAIGTVSGIVNPMDVLFPPEPGAVGMLDNTIEGFNHDNTPKKISFSLVHNGTGAFFIHGIEFKTKRPYDIECMVPADDDPVLRKAQEQYINPVPARMFPPVDITVTPKDHFTTVDIAEPFRYSNGDQLVFDYAYVDELGMEITDSIGLQYWDYRVTYSEDGNEANAVTIPYHSHAVENVRFCK